MRLRRFSLLALVVIFSSYLVARVPQADGTQAAERLATDTPKTTVQGNAFIAPKDWSIRTKGPATILEAPEGGSWIALVDVQAEGPDQAVAAAWQAYRPDATWPVKVSNALPDRDGWTKRRSYDYLTSPNEKRNVFALVSYAGSSWTVVIEDLADAVGEKRGGQVALVFSRLLPKGYTRESFAGKKANTLDQRRIAELARFIEQGQKETGVPGVALGLVQDGKVIFADGFGVKELGGSEKPDGNTLFMVASNTKALTTLLLAKMVDEHRLTWTTQVTSLFPEFRLGNPETTRSVQVKHLICACTGCKPHPNRIRPGTVDPHLCQLRGSAPARILPPPAGIRTAVFSHVRGARLRTAICGRGLRGLLHTGGKHPAPLQPRIEK